MIYFSREVGPTATMHLESDWSGSADETRIHTYSAGESLHEWNENPE